MPVLRRQKLFIISLLIYWPLIFTLAHIPIPQLVRKAGVSDKIIHLVAYLLLVFLMWFAANPDGKVNWRKAAAWWVLLVAVAYGIIDELLQGVVAGRSCDIMDFVADLTGVLTGLVLFTFLTFWPAFLVVTGITIFALTNLTRVNLAELVPITYVAFHPLAYGFFTVLWIQNMHLFLPLKAPELKWLMVASALPTAFLVMVKVFSAITGRFYRLQDAVVAAVGIAAVVITVYLLGLFRCRRSRTVPDT